MYRRHARASQPGHSPDLWLRVRYSHRFGGGLARQRRRGLVPHDPRTPVNPRERPGRAGRRGRERNVSVALLAAIAITISAALMTTLAAQPVLARNTLTYPPPLIH